MNSQLKHNAPTGVFSQYQPTISLNKNVRNIVNEFFLLPIISEFFKNRGGAHNFCELDPDKLITEVEFVETLNLVQTYIYKEIIDNISKPKDLVLFQPKYVITFDQQLANYRDESAKYPYKSIFQQADIFEANISYGVIRLGVHPILYYIYVDFNKLNQFLKTVPIIPEKSEIVKSKKTDIEKRNELLNKVIFEYQKQLDESSIQESLVIQKEINRLNSIKNIAFEGSSGKLRVNLTWSTTDDLDLHIISPNGEISYKQKTLESSGIIAELDVDRNAGDPLLSNPQENINFDGTPLGLHTIFVELYQKREKENIPFTVSVISENLEGRVYNQTISNNVKYVGTFEFVDNQLLFEEFIV